MARTLGQELKAKVRNALALAALVLAGPGLAACGGEGEASDAAEPSKEFGEQREALTAEQSRVLGFESAVADWTVNVGSRAASTNVTQGVQSIAVSPNG